MIWVLWRPRESKSQDQQYRTLSGLRHRMAVASRPAAEPSSRFSRALNSLGLSEVILGIGTSQLR